MPLDQLLLLGFGLILIAAVAVSVAVATSGPPRSAEAPPAPSPRASDTPRADLAVISVGAERPREDDAAEETGWLPTWLPLTPASTRQVARVVAFLFLAAVAAVVALSGAWSDNEPAIFTLLAAGTLLVVLFMDMLPPSVMGRARRPLEGVGAIVFLGLLMALTGGSTSPFLVGFFLVVAGSSLSTEGYAPLLIALAAAATIAVSGFAAAGLGGLDALGIATVGFSAVALVLLADIASAAARSQRQARDEALRASRFDPLTGLYNRAFFFTTMEQEIRRSDRMGRGFTMLMLDIDDFKPVNDTFGHQAGDRLLRATADVIRATIRFTDSAARYGGDEFVVLLPETDASGGFVVGEKLRRDISGLSMRAGDRDVRSSVSVGIVNYPADGGSVEQLVAAADMAMYESKRRGKNRIVGYQTRFERVATDIDSASARLVQLTATDEARTGGDPAPWGARLATAEPLADVPDPGPVRSSGIEQRRGDPDERRSRLDDAADEQAPDAPTDDDEGTERTEPDDDDPDDGTSAATSRGVDRADRAWLTRPRAPDAERPSAGDEQTPPEAGPAGEGRSGEAGRSTERPWIALPIEPYEPPRG